MKVVISFILLIFVALNVRAEVLNYVGFEVGDQAESSANSGTQFSTTIVRTGTTALKILPTLTTSTPYFELSGFSVSGASATLSSNTVKLTAWINPAVYPPSAEENIFYIADNGTSPGEHKFSLNITTDGHLKAYGGSAVTLLGTSTNSVPLDTWSRLQITVNTGTNVAYETMIGSNPEISGNGNLGTNPVGRIRIGKYSNVGSQIYTAYWDDITLSDSDYFGNVKITRVGLNGDASPTDWKGGTNDSDFLEVSEVIRDEDTSYVSCFNSLGTKSHYFTLENVQDLSLGGVIKAVSIAARARKESATVSSFVLRFRTGDIVSDTSNKDLSTSYNTLKKIKTTNMLGGPWIYSDLDSLEIGILENNALNDRVTQVFAMILWDPDEQYVYDPILVHRRLIEDY